MNQQRWQGQPQPPRPKLVVKTTDNFRTVSGGFATKVQARLTGHDNPENLDVQVDGRPVHSSIIDPDSELVVEVPLPGPGVFVVTILVPDLHLQQTRHVTITAPSGGVPHDLEIRASDPTPQGVTRAIVTIVDANGRGVRGKVCILRPSATVQTIPTNNRGFVEVRLSTKRTTEEVELVVAGTAINKRITILGPRPQKPRYRDVRLSDDEIWETNPWQAFLAGLRGGRKK